ncbi:MAG: NfeD family protein [Pirellulales bacterium]
MKSSILYRTVGMLILLLVLSASVRSQDAAAPPAEKAAQPDPISKLVTLTSPIDDRALGRVRTAGLTLQNQAAQENRRAVLVLQITPGSSEFHQVQGLARFLTSADLSKVTTVAWVPETVTGNNVVAALACKEIVMHPDAALGDIGRGSAPDKIDQQFILSLAEKRHNRMLSPAIVRGMMDPQQVVLKIQTQAGKPGAEQTETRVVTPDELKRLVDTGAIVTKRETILDAGDSMFSGSKARALEVLIVQTAENIAELAESYHLAPESLRESPTDGNVVDARIIEIHGMIDPLLGTFVQRQISRAVESGANVLIFDIDSPGGFLQTSQDLANSIAYLDAKQVRTVAYIPKQALSGAAIIALGCDDIYMDPNAHIGDAAPIEIREGQWFERAPEKVLSDLVVTLRSLAELKKRPAALVIAMADRSLDVYKVTHRENGRVWYMSQDEIDAAGGEWIRKELVPQTRGDLLLTVSGEDAHTLKLAGPPVADLDELKSLLGIASDVKLRVVGPTWVDTLVFLLNTNFALGLLITIGVIAIFVEVHFMTGLLGIVSALCFALVFWSRFMGGTAGWLEIMLFLLGMACIGLEIFVIPGFGVFGVSGGLLVITALVMASQTFEIAGDGGPSNASRMTETAKTLSVSIVAIVVLMMALNRFLPRIPLFKSMVLTPPGYGGTEEDSPRLNPAYTHSGAGAAVDSLHSLVGAQGETLSILRPSGKARISGRFLDVVSDGPYIERGRTVEVVQVSGNRVVVREV